MKARVKATGEIVDGKAMVSFNGDDFYLDELESLDDDPDYWTRLEHQYAGMAMQGILSNQKYIEKIIEKKEFECFSEDLAAVAIHLATAHVNKLKGE